MTQERSQPPILPLESSPYGMEHDPTPPLRVPEGFLLLDRADRWRWGKFSFNLFFLTLWNIICVPLFTITFFYPITDLWSVILRIFYGVFTFVGLITIVSFIQKAVVNSQLFPGEVIVPKFPLLLGESCWIRYHRQLRRKQVKKTGKISAQLLCYEWVQDTGGSSTSTFTHVLWKQDLPTQDILNGTSKFEYECRIQIPRNGIPSFVANHNQIRWELHVSLDLPGLPKGTSSYRLHVEPERIA